MNLFFSSSGLRKFANAAARNAAAPLYWGEEVIQLDTATYYYGGSAVVGDWSAGKKMSAVEILGGTAILSTLTVNGPIRMGDPATGNRIVIGNAATITGDDGVAIGRNAAVVPGVADPTRVAGVAVGLNSSAKGWGIAIGEFATAGEIGIAIGHNASGGPLGFAAGLNVSAPSQGAVAIGFNMTVGQGSIGIGESADAPQNYGTSVGYMAKTVARGVAIGVLANASAGSYAVAIGDSSVAGGNSTIAIGNLASVTGSSTIALGNSAQAPSNYAVAIGYQAQAPTGGLCISADRRDVIRIKGEAEFGSTAIGPSALASGDDSVAVGRAASANQGGGVVIGSNASVANDGPNGVVGYSVAVGHSSSAKGDSVAVGMGAVAGERSLAIGRGATAGFGSTAIGYFVTAPDAATVFGGGATATGTYAAAIGIQAQASGSATAIGGRANANVEVGGLNGYGVAIGMDSFANGYQSTAIGARANAASFGLAIACNSQNVITADATGKVTLPLGGAVTGSFAVSGNITANALTAASYIQSASGVYYFVDALLTNSGGALHVRTAANDADAPLTASTVRADGGHFLGTGNRGYQLDLLGTSSVTGMLQRGANNAYASLQFSPFGALTPSNPQWQTGLYPGEASYSIGSWDTTNGYRQWFAIAPNGTPTFSVPLGIASGGTGTATPGASLYFGTDAGGVKGYYTLPSGGGGGSGDVAGPAGATDTAVALFSGTTGKLLKNSTVTVTAAGVMTVQGITSPGTGASTEQFGANASTGTGTGNLAIGPYATITAGGNAAIAIGGSATAGNGGMAIGGAADCLGNTSMAIGYNSHSGGGSSVALGPTASANGYTSVAVGSGAFADFPSSCAIGFSARATADHQLVLGGNYPASWGFNDVYIGNGVTNTTFHADTTINATGGEGTDQSAASLIIAGGKGTGIGTPGKIIFKTATPGATGTTLQTLMERASISESGMSVAGVLQVGPTPGAPSATSGDPLAVLRLGSLYGNTDLGRNFKIRLFEVPGTPGQTYGLGVSGSLLEITAGEGANIGFFTTTGSTSTERMRVKNTGEVAVINSLAVTGANFYSGATFAVRPYADNNVQIWGSATGAALGNVNNAQSAFMPMTYGASKHSFVAGDVEVSAHVKVINGGAVLVGPTANAGNTADFTNASHNGVGLMRPSNSYYNYFFFRSNTGITAADPQWQVGTGASSTSLSLGRYDGGVYDDLKIDNTGKIALGVGSAGIKKIVYGSGTSTATSVGANSIYSYTLTVTGARPNHPCFVGISILPVSSTFPYSVSAYCVANDQIVVQFLNISSNTFTVPATVVAVTQFQFN